MGGWGGGWGWPRPRTSADSYIDPAPPEVSAAARRARKSKKVLSRRAVQRPNSRFPAGIGCVFGGGGPMRHNSPIRNSSERFYSFLAPFLVGPSSSAIPITNTPLAPKVEYVHPHHLRPVNYQAPHRRL